MTEQRISDETPGHWQEVIAQKRGLIRDLTTVLEKRNAALAEAQRENERLTKQRDEAIERCDDLELAVQGNLPEVTTDADGNLESDEVCRIETVGLLYRELEQHVAALRDVLQELVDTLSIEVSDETHAKADAILANTAAGSTAWLAAHDAEKDELLNGGSVKGCADALLVMLDPDYATRLAARDAEEAAIDAEKDAQIAALVAAVHEYDKALGYAAQMCALIRELFPYADDVAGETRNRWQRLADLIVETDAHAQAMAPQIDQLANLPAAAAAYTADVRRAALEESAKASEQEGEAAYARAEEIADAMPTGVSMTEAEYYRTAHRVAAARIRALAAQPPEQK